MNIELGSAQGQGDREEQQDAFRAVSGDHFAVVADGVGGLRFGGQAAQTAVAQFAASFSARLSSESIPQAMERSLLQANSAVGDWASRAGVFGDCACTLVAATAEDGNLFWISAGDSRAYLMRNGVLFQLTTDHKQSMVLGDKVANRELTREAASADPDRDALISALGRGQLPHIDRNRHPLRLLPGDRIILCTDGIYQIVTEPDMGDCCRAATSQDCCDRIAARVAESGVSGKDNYTVAVLTPILDAASVRAGAGPPAAAPHRIDHPPGRSPLGLF